MTRGRLTLYYFFFFNDTATTEIYTLSLHDALPISPPATASTSRTFRVRSKRPRAGASSRSEEHTSELQSQSNLVCRLLLEKKKKISATSGNVLEHRLATAQRVHIYPIAHDPCIAGH